MSFGGTAVDFERRINFDRMRKDRIQRVKKAAREKGVAAMISLHSDNMRYLGHNYPKEFASGVSGFRFMFFPMNSQPILYEYGMWLPYTRSGLDWIETRYAPSLVSQGPLEARKRQAQKAAAALKNDLKDANLLKEPVALDASHPGLIAALEQEGVKTNLLGEEVMSEARMIKTPDEVECLRTACSIVEGAYDEVKRTLRTGVTEREIHANFVAKAYRLGAEFAPSGNVTSGPRTFAVNNITSDRIVRHGDLVVVKACGTAFMGYKACLYRTFAPSAPSETQKDCFSQTRDILTDAIKVVKPGATTKDLAEKWPKATEFGYKDEEQALWIQWGHGVGLHIPEEPTASRLWSFDYPQTFKEGMVLALEDWLPTKERSGMYPRGQSVRIEEMVVVTSSGSELLSDYPLDELVRTE